LSPSAPALLPSQHEEATLKQQIQLTMDWNSEIMSQIFSSFLGICHRNEELN
jgi:hypothetical protein